MNQVKVLQFITPAGFYGAERWILALANNSHTDAIDIQLAVTKESETQDLSVARYFKANGGVVHQIPMAGRFDLRAVKALVQLIRDNDIDIIHTHGYKSDILGFLASRWAGIKCVSTPHGFSNKVDFKLGLFIKLGVFFLRYFDQVAPLSEELMTDMKTFKVPVEKTALIRNGVDLKEIDATIAELKDKPESNALGAKKIGYIGQLIPRKCVNDLLDVFNELYQDDNSLALELIGEGSQKEALQKKASTLPSKEAIEFLGFKEDRFHYLSKFSLFVMTSSLEGIPRCIMEAMSFGIPVVAYDIPGVDKLVKDHETGLLAKFGDKESLKLMSKKALYDPALCHTLTQNGRNFIEAQYSAKRMAEEYEMLYQKMLASDSNKRKSTS